MVNPLTAKLKSASRGRLLNLIEIATDRRLANAGAYSDDQLREMARVEIARVQAEQDERDDEDGGVSH
jgi:hypothetical protein